MPFELDELSFKNIVESSQKYFARQIEKVWYAIFSLVSAAYLAKR